MSAAICSSESPRLAKNDWPRQASHLEEQRQALTTLWGFERKEPSLAYWSVLPGADADVPHTVLRRMQAVDVRHDGSPSTLYMRVIVTPCLMPSWVSSSQTAALVRPSRTSRTGRRGLSAGAM
jgi:hypothetical protein